MARQQQRTAQLARALGFFARHNIDVMLIKGSALEYMVYDKPWYTIVNDIDLVLLQQPDQLDATLYREIDDFLFRSGVEYDYFAHHDVTMNGVIPVDFAQVWSDASTVSIAGCAVRLMCSEDLLISLCINSCRKRYFRLKSLCDIAETIARRRDLEWSRVYEKATAYDCRPIVYTALHATALTLNCALPEDFLDKARPGPLRTRLIDAMLPHMSLSAYSSFHVGKKVLNKRVHGSLLLKYATLYWYQVAGSMRVAA
jgi:hypothetical protein